MKAIKVLNKFVTAALVFGICLSAAADGNTPNNTSTRVSEYYSFDGVVTIESGHVFSHYYGDAVVLKLKIKKLSYDKEIYVQSMDETRKVTWVQHESDFKGGGATALWVRDSGEFEYVYVKIPQYSLVSRQTGRLNPHMFAVYVKMNGISYSVERIKLSNE